jgi:anti-anti-sigma factor
MHADSIVVTVNVTLTDDVVYVHGELDRKTAPDLDAGLQAVTGPLLLDLRGVRFMDASALGVLVRHHRRRVADGEDFRLIALSCAARRVLDDFGLLEVFAPGERART